MILESQVNKSIKEKVLEFKTKINRIIEISELWLQVQYRVRKKNLFLFFLNFEKLKWLWLEKIYSDIDSYVRPTQDSILFQSVVADFKDFQNKINADPYVMNILKDDSYKPKLNELLNKFVIIIFFSI